MGHRHEELKETKKPTRKKAHPEAKIATKEITNTEGLRLKSAYNEYIKYQMHDE